MPVVVDPENAAVSSLLAGLPTGAQGVLSVDRMHAWLAQHADEYVVVLGPTVTASEALALCDQLRTARPTVSVVLIRDELTTEVLTAAMQAGARDVIPSGSLETLTAAVTRAHQLFVALRGPGGATHTGKIVTVWSPKGGVGKTTVAVNLGLALTEGGARRVCVVDLDLAFGDVAIALQLFPAHTIADAVPLGEYVDFGAVQALLTPHSPGLTTLVAPVEPGSGEGIPATLVSRLLQVLRDHFDYVIVDTPPAFDDHVLSAFDLSDIVALIATLDIPALKNLKLTLETMDLLNYPRDRWRVVLNRADSKVGLAINEVEKSLRATISAQIPSSRDVPAAINRGVPIVLDDPRHPVSVAIKTFAEHYVANVNPGQGGRGGQAPARPERRGLLRRRSKA